MYIGAFRDISYKWGRGNISSVPVVYNKCVLEHTYIYIYYKIVSVHMYECMSVHVPQYK